MNGIGVLITELPGGHREDGRPEPQAAPLHQTWSLPAPSRAGRLMHTVKATTQPVLFLLEQARQRQRMRQFTHRIKDTYTHVMGSLYIEND